MKKISVACGIVLLMVLSYFAGRRHPAPHESAGASNRRVLYWIDPMHPDYKSNHPGIAPDCGMELEPVYAGPVSASVSSAAPPLLGSVSIDAARQQLFGIRIASVEKTSGTEELRVLGRVVPEDTRVFKVDSGMDGFVRETFNDSVGELVKKDQKLASYYGADSLSVASGFLAATAGVNPSNNRDGNRTMAFPGAVSKQGFSSVQGYSDRLRNLGMSEVQIEQMSQNRQLPESVDVVSPVEGFIITRSISPGQHFDRSVEFYRIADLSKVWIVADVYGSEAQNLRPGTIARVTLTDQKKAFTARVSNVLPQVDPLTRTLKLRLEADNPGFALRPDMFVDVELPVPIPAGLTAPLDAVIDSGREKRVFVERTSGEFEPRQVHVGWRSGERVEIVDGLAEGERVVTAGTFLVDSESRLKSVQTVIKPPAPHEKTTPKSSPGPNLAVTSIMVKDAACGMMIDKAQSVAEGNTLTKDGVTYYFCSQSCKRKFSARPEHYLALNPSGHRS
jgi:Cu(I)/Ag(I) efflux system membrane fusion protein